jgi:hypothetical protein
MGTKLKTVSVRLDEESGAQVEKAAALLRQSQGAFLARVGEEAARNVLLDWAADEYRSQRASLSELAAETGLALEGIAQRIVEQRSELATEMYLASARKLAETLDIPDFYEAATRAVEAAKAQG